VAAISDDIAYNNHDLADGLRAGPLHHGGPAGAAADRALHRRVDARWPGLAPARREHEALRRFFGLLVEDVLATSGARLAAAAPAAPEDVRGLGAPVIRFSDGTFAELKRIRSFLFHRMYRHWTVQRMRRKAGLVVRELFELFFEAPAPDADRVVAPAAAATTPGAPASSPTTSPA
jgi:dGTPase